MKGFFLLSLYLQCQLLPSAISRLKLITGYVCSRFLKIHFLGGCVTVLAEIRILSFVGTGVHIPFSVCLLCMTLKSADKFSHVL